MIVNVHLIPFFGEIKLKDLRPIHIEEYQTTKLKNGRIDGKGGLSARTVSYHIIVLSKALQHSVDVDQLIPRNVAKLVKKPSYETPDFNPTFIEGVIKLLKD